MKESTTKDLARKDIIEKHELFLFDFDGLLVNTEALHHHAYIAMCKERGYDLDWDFEHYCQIAHFEAHGLQREICNKFPGLKEIAWDLLYQEKKQAYLDLVFKGDVSLMPGAAKLIEKLLDLGKTIAVVTHSPLEQIKAIRQQNPSLDLITHWITRENYKIAKPDPECYIKAMKMLLKEGQKALGFEDSPRGLKALKASGAYSVWVTGLHYPQEREILENCHCHIESLEALV